MATTTAKLVTYEDAVAISDRVAIAGCLTLGDIAVAYRPATPVIAPGSRREPRLWGQIVNGIERPVTDA